MGPIPAALQIFLFKPEGYLGAELFDGLLPVMVGRGPDAQLQLHGDTVSRTHCRISLEGGEVWVEDLGSGNGTFINRTRLRGRVRIAPTDTVYVGPYTLKVRPLRVETARTQDSGNALEDTRIEPILNCDESGVSEDFPIDLAGDLDQRLYADALRRKTGTEVPQPPPAALDDRATDAAAQEAPAAAPARAQAPANNLRQRPRHQAADSTMMAAAHLSLRPDSVQPRPADVKLDPMVEARLKDLDDLIAALDGGTSPRPGSRVPWSSSELESVVPADEGPHEETPLDRSASMSTREFARDLASRLALDGQVVAGRAAPAEPLPREHTADVIPIHRKPTGVPVDARSRPPSAPLGPDEDTTRGGEGVHMDEEPTFAADDAVIDDRPVEPSQPGSIEISLDDDDAQEEAPAARLQDDGDAPETELMDRSLPVPMPVVVSAPPKRPDAQDVNQARAEAAAFDPSGGQRIHPDPAGFHHAAARDRGVAPARTAAPAASERAVAPARTAAPSAPERAVAPARTAAPSAPERGAAPARTAAPAAPERGAAPLRTAAAPARTAAPAASERAVAPARGTPSRGVPAAPSRALDLQAPATLPPAPVPGGRMGPPPLPKRTPGHAHEARLMTPTSLRVGVRPLPPAGEREDDSLYDDVWTRSGRTANPVAPSIVAKQTVGAAPSRSRVERRATEVRPKSRIDDFDPSQGAEKAPALRDAQFDGVEISARAGGKAVDIAVLRRESEQYILGHATPQGTVAPASTHLGLRMLRINADRTVDMVFPCDVGGHLVRGNVTVMFNELTEGRKYSCLRLEPQDIATIILGSGRNTISYHVRFLRRPKSLFNSLRRTPAEP